MAEPWHSPAQLPMRPRLFEFQEEGRDWLRGRPARTGFLADYMGIGKSVQALAAAEGMSGLSRIDIICPAIAATDWERKFEQWWPGCTVPHQQVSYEHALSYRKEMRKSAGRGPGKKLLILDEAHYLKNPAAKRTRAIYGGFCRGFGGIVDAYDYVWPMSGTPMPNGDPREMWPHLRALAPYTIIDAVTGQPMTYGAFSSRFCALIPDGFGLKFVGLQNVDEFKDILDRFMLQRGADVAGLPPLRFEVYPMRPKELPTDLATAQWPGLSQAFQGIINAAGQGDLDQQLKTQLGTLRRLTGMLKVQATVDLVREEMRSGALDKVVVFGYHVDVVEEISQRLADFGSSVIHGGVDSKARWENIDRFQLGSDRVIVCQITAASVNTTLTAAHNVIFAETDWVPENNAQAAARCRRVDGNTRFPVLARIIAICGTIDELLQQAARTKIARTLLLNQR
ncbi:MAG: DEAD/DEAH box helicase [Patescibacteria group bacterium]|nr:DEAD/DEAH box helicase [Patescibacteria group bacterium]